MGNIENFRTPRLDNKNAVVIDVHSSADGAEQPMFGKFTLIGNAAGNLAGIAYAVKHKTGFWKGLGWFFIFGVAGSLTGYIIDEVTTKKNG